MNKRGYIINLYDIYKELFTEKQRSYFENYYYEDLSLSEIAEIYNVSKTIVGKTLKTIEDKLNNYEEKLSLNKIIENIETIKNKTTDEETKKELEDIIKG